MRSSKPQLKIVCYVLITFLVTCWLTSASMAQHGPSRQTELERGIELFDQGKYADAITSLQLVTKRDKNDPVAWRYLALAFEKTNNTSEAVRAHKNAASVTPEYFFEKYNVTRPEGLERWFHEARPALSAAAASGIRVLDLDAKAQSNPKEWKDRISLLSDYATVSSGDEVTERARILSRPTPEYTEEARRQQFSGNISVLVILAEDGKVKRILPLRRLLYGLTDQAIAAAQRIKFVPAKLNGKSVSQLVLVEYTFNIF